MRELLDDIDRWRAAGKPVAIARVGRHRGLRPTRAGRGDGGQQRRRGGRIVSGGCVEGAVVSEALAILNGEAEPRIITFGYSDDEAFAVGLTCGGTIRLFVEPLDWCAR